MLPPVKILSLHSTFAFQISHTTLSNDPENKILLYIHSDRLRKLMKMNACIFSADFLPAIFLLSVYSVCTLLPSEQLSPPEISAKMDLIEVIKIRASETLSHPLTFSLRLLLCSLFFTLPQAHSSSPFIFYPHHPSSSLLHSPSIPLCSSSSSLLLTPRAPAPSPSLTQGPCVPVCNISKAVRQPGQGKQPSAGFRGDGGRDVFPQEPRDPWRLLAGAREGQRGEDDPLSCPPQEHTLANLSFSFLLITLSLRHFLFLHLCTQSSSTASPSHIHSNSSALSHTPALLLSYLNHSCLGRKDTCICTGHAF